jgi:hypothetical protein
MLMHCLILMQVRARAQFVNGENRTAYNDGGNTLLSASLQPAGVSNSFYLEIHITNQIIFR